MKISGISQNNFARPIASKTQNNKVYSAASFKGMEDSVSFTGHNKLKAGIAAFMLTLAGFLSGGATAKAMAAAPAPTSTGTGAIIEPIGCNGGLSSFPSYAPGPTMTPETPTPTIGISGNAREILSEAEAITPEGDEEALRKNTIQLWQERMDSYNEKLSNLKNDDYKDRSKLIANREDGRNWIVNEQLALIDLTFEGSKAEKNAKKAAVAIEQYVILQNEVKALDKQISESKDTSIKHGSLTQVRDELAERAKHFKQMAASFMEASVPTTPQTIPGPTSTGIICELPAGWGHSNSSPVPTQAPENPTPTIGVSAEGAEVIFEAKAMTPEGDEEALHNNIINLWQERIDNYNERLEELDYDSNEAGAIIRKREYARQSMVKEEIALIDLTSKGSNADKARDKAAVTISQYVNLKNEIQTLDKEIANAKKGSTKEGKLISVKNYLLTKVSYFQKLTSSFMEASVPTVPPTVPEPTRPNIPEEIYIP